MLKKNIDVDEYFLVCREIEECVKAKNNFINNQHAFKEFVNYCYKNTIFKFMNNCIYDIADLYIYLTSIKSTIVYDNVFFNKIDCILDIIALYDEINFDSFSKIMKSNSFRKIIFFQTNNVKKIDKIKKIILEFESYMVKYDVCEFADLVFNGFISSEYKHLSFMELLKQNRLDLDSVETLANLQTRDYEDLILLKIVDKAGLEFRFETVRNLYQSLKILGSSKRNACEIYAERNDIILNEEIFEDENLLDSAFETFFKSYIVVDAFGKMWGCKIN